MSAGVALSRSPAISIESDLPAIVTADAILRWTVRVQCDQDLPAGSVIGLARHWPSDWGVPQRDAPEGADFVAAAASDGSRAECRVGRQPDWHPFDHALVVDLPDGLSAGASLSVTFGPPGSAGHRVQTFAEDASPLSVRVRLGSRGTWDEVERILTRVVGGALARLAATAPSVVGPGERFVIHVLGEDRWGNPASDLDLGLVLPDLGIEGRLTSCDGSVARIEATLPAPGTYRLIVEDAAGAWRALTNPIRCEVEPAHRLYWGDLHAQSSIGCGAQSIESYFRFARDVAALDLASHQGNCFLVSNADWAETGAVTRRLNQDDRFVALLGYEWSGATPVGGDHNLFFPADAAEIRRASHRHLADRSDAASDLPHVTDLHDHVRGRDLLMQVHVGGRTSSLDWHEPTTERLLEVHSTHATSEWFLHEALRRGWKFGVTGGSDGVDGRPGRSRPGRMSVRNLGGGLVAVAAPELSRGAVWSALGRRRTYATTGERILLDVRCGDAGFGEDLRMSKPPTLRISVDGTAPLRSVEIFRGTERVFGAAIRPEDSAPSDVLRVAWRGASGPGNWERARMVWDGSLTLSGADIVEARPFAMDTAAEGIESWTARGLAWTSITAGDWDGVELRLRGCDGAILGFHSPPLDCVVALDDLRESPWSRRLREPDRELRVEWLPRIPASASWSGTWTDPEPIAGEAAYWVRVEQDDGGLAWSSPIHVTVAP